MSIRRIGIVSVPVSDQEAAKRFYTEVLDFRVIRENPMGPDQRWVQLGPEEGETTITLVTWFDTMPAGTLSGMCLDSDDIRATHSELRKRGLEISDVVDEPWGSFATFEDPDGNAWVLQQVAAEA